MAEENIKKTRRKTKKNIEAPVAEEAPIAAEEAEVEAQVTEAEAEMVTNEEVAQVNGALPPAKIPKKRGRKPKGGKIIQNNILNIVNTIHEPNIILHLKIFVFPYLKISLKHIF